MVKRKINTKRIKLTQGSKFIQPTGEIIEVDNGSFTIIEQTETDKHTVSSSNYLYLDADALINLTQMQSNSSFHSAIGFLVGLCGYLDYTTNILLDKKGVPLNAKTIAAHSNSSLKSVYNKIKILEEHQLIATYKSESIQFKNQKVVSVNPSLLRRGKNFHSSMVKRFLDLTINPENISPKNQALLRNQGQF
jgi:hypothetical protein